VSRQPFFPDREKLLASGPGQAALHERALQAALDHFGRRVFIRGVVEVSNFCRENCTYCGMRRDNRELHRFRASVDALAELLVHHRPPSLTDLNIQTGEDPLAVHQVVLPLVRILRRETPLGISVCLGTLTPQLYRELQEAGASIYIMKFETADPARYASLQAPGNLAERTEHIRLLASRGWHVSSGFIAGLPGTTPDDLLPNFTLARDLPLLLPLLLLLLLLLI
jgi:biotin synthase